MATNKSSRNGQNNNPDGRNQYSGVMGTARSNPLSTAVAVGGAVAAGVFLWSRRSQISYQIGSLADQIGEWREGSEPSAGDTVALEDSNHGGARTQAQIAEEALTLKQTGESA